MARRSRRVQLAYAADLDMVYRQLRRITEELASRTDDASIRSLKGLRRQQEIIERKIAANLGKHDTHH